MKIETSHATVTAEALARFGQDSATRAERQFVKQAGDAERVGKAADELVGTTFFATLLEQAEGSRQKKGYFNDTGVGRFFKRQLHLELARHVSLSERFHLGQAITNQIVKQMRGGTEE